jgi:beta propeller repeat protein
MNCINSVWIKGILASLALVMILLVPVSCASTPPEQKEKALAVALESWQVGEHWMYSPQSIWEDKLVFHEVLFGDVRVAEQYISLYDLRTREKQRITEIRPDYLVNAPSTHNDRVVWASCYYSQEMWESPQKDILALNWDVFLLDLKTGEVQQLTTEEHAQIEPRIYGDTIVWLDTRHEEGYHNPKRYDVYTHDLRTGQERRLTSATSTEDEVLSISGNLVVWSDNRHANPEVTVHAGNEPDYNNEIYVYDLATNQERRVTTYPGNDHYPAIDGGRIVWLRQLTLREADVFLYDLSSGQETRVSSSGYAVYNPAIHDDRIVWADARISEGNTSGDVVMNDMSGAAEIYLYNLNTRQETLLVPSTGTEHTLEVRGQERKFMNRQVWMNPVIHDDFVVYTLERQIGSIVYAMRLADK